MAKAVILPGKDKNLLAMEWGWKGMERRVHVAWLGQDENLSSDRFTKYTTSKLYHIVTKNYFGEADRYDYYGNIAKGSEIIDWISQNIKGKWNIDIDYWTVHHVDVLWCFENKDDAVLFKLTW